MMTKFTPRKVHGVRILPVLAVLLGGLCSQNAAAASVDDSEVAFLEQQAIARTLAARSPDDFTAAAAAYEALLEAGIRNAQIYFNYGTALLMAGQNEAAQSALRQAERYAGANWDTERNLRLARTAPGGAQAGLPWYRVPLFWHFRLATQPRVTLACGAFLAAWIFATLRLLGVARFTRWGFAISVCALILLGSSAGTSLYQNAHARAAFTRPPHTVPGGEVP
jgi:tetratricopeptide (TPR) repeat protein